MTETSAYNFTCPVCSTQDPTRGYYYASTDEWIFAYPEKDFIHVHFGPAANSLDQGFEEAKWNVDTVIYDILKRNPEKKFFVMIDLSRKNNTQFAPKKTIFEYKKLLTHPQISEIAHYDVPLAVKAIVEIIRVLTMAKIRYHVVPTYVDAECLYMEWRDKRHHS